LASNLLNNYTRGISKLSCYFADTENIGIVYLKAFRQCSESISWSIIMTHNKHSRVEMLRRLYLSKCGQIEKAKESTNTLRCQVLKVEAEAIKAEIDII